MQPQRIYVSSGDEPNFFPLLGKYVNHYSMEALAG